MKAFVINLQSSINRRESMSRELSRIPSLQAEFFPATDGRLMTEQEIEECFSQKGAYKHYGRQLMRGEIGCTLSHLRCFQGIVRRGIPAALILEDDVVLDGCFNKDFNRLEKFLTDELEPTIVLLSGHYWYISRFNEEIVKVFSAYYTHAYAINYSAAKLLSGTMFHPWHLADDWFHIIKCGVRLLAMKPHWINQISDENTSEVLNSANDERGINKRNLKLKPLVESYYIGGMKKMLYLCGKFEGDKF